ncbi:signal peptide peptidase SppA [Myroides sp. LJL115]
MKFLGNVLATILGLCLFFGLLLVLLIGLGAAMGSSDTVVVKDNSVIVLDLSKVKYDYSGKFNYKEFSFKDQPKNGLSNVLDAVNRATEDSRISGITLVNQHSGLGIVQMRELRQALQDFKDSGKFVMAYADYYTQKDFYLNSVADSIFLNPVGMVDFKGLSVEILYLKDLQEKTGIKMEVLRHGKYKSAVEPYLENKMSEANHIQTTEFLNSIWTTIATDIAKSRSISLEQINQAASNLYGNTALGALEHKLVDRVAYQDEFEASVKSLVDVAQDKEYNKITILDYIKAPSSSNVKLSADQIAIVYAQGQILSGEGNVSYVGELSINRALKKARENDKVKAVVLRVNSPGGSALTSELIWREVELTKAVKPVIVSMGDVAASGGYYIACGADYIFADPATITGSIGVFGMLPNVSTLSEKYGVNPQIVQTHKNAANYSIFAPLSPEYKQTVTQSIEQIYTTFVSRVATGRNMSFQQVDELAQGRVWVGADALKNGLIDAYGGLDQAIAYAVEKTEVQDYRVVEYPEYELNFEDLLNNYFGSSIFKSQDQLILEKIGEQNYQLLQRLNYFSNLQGNQTILPYELNIQ